MSEAVSAIVASKSKMTALIFLNVGFYGIIASLDVMMKRVDVAKVTVDVHHDE